VAVPTQMRFLLSARINRIIGTLASELELRRPLNFLNRLPIVSAFDDEITGRFTGHVIAADVIADDQKANVQDSLQLELVSDTIPNIKIGQRLGQRLLNRLYQLMNSGNVMGQNALKNWDMQLAANLLLAIRQRQNAMACAMMLDTFTYARFGVNITGASWGMPAGLKVTSGVAWNGNPTTATPLSDIWSLDQYARLNYGIAFNVVTMGTLDFRDMIATTEFANKAWQTLGASFLTTSAALPTKNDPAMLAVAGRVLGKTILLDDTTYNERNAAGTFTTTRVLPAHKVLLSRSQDEGDGQIMDLANGVTTESIAANLMTTDMIGADREGGVPPESYGPIAYYTPRADLNPPDCTAWGVARSFPRKFQPEATAVLTVG
jgi:hypothetical protein